MQKLIPTTVLEHILVKYKGQINFREANKILSNYSMNPTLKSWDEAQITWMIKNFIKARKDQEEDMSIFEEEDTPPQNLIKGRTSKIILKEISKKFQSESNFKILCNKIFKLAKRYLKDKKTKHNFEPILAKDYEKNPEILSLLDELCTKHELICELKPNGMLIKINPASFEGNLSALISVLKNFKDESLGIVSNRDTKDKAARKRNVTDERVQAMREAQQRRQNMHRANPQPQNPRMMNQGQPPVYPAQNGYYQPQNQYPPMQRGYPGQGRNVYPNGYPYQGR